MALPSDIARLRSRIAALEGAGVEASAGAAPLGLPALDRALPWGGLPFGALHEILPVSAADGGGAAIAFAAFLLGRLAAKRSRPVLWVGDEPYAPGLVALGLTPERLLVVRPRRAGQILWAVEEGLHCPALAAVLGEVHGLDLTASRRLQLAARASGVSVLALNRGEATGAATTRWRVGTAESRAARGVGAWAWRIELARCRGRTAGPGCWDVEWNDETGGLRLAAVAGDRPAAPIFRRATG